VTIQLDANGLPLGHESARAAAAKELAELINELPESVYHLNATDAEWLASNVLLRYLKTLGAFQRPALTMVTR
jgi:hypothetical protein